MGRMRYDARSQRREIRVKLVTWIVGLVCFSFGFIFGLLGGAFLFFLLLVKPSTIMERYWNNIVEVTLPAWQWCIMSISTIIPVIAILIYTAIKKREVHIALPLFLLGAFAGSLTYAFTHIPFK